MPRILIVEDSLTQSEAVRLILEEHGFTAVVAVDAEAALRLLQDTAFDLILSDVLMPGMSGYEFCRRVKTQGATKHIPLVLLTQLNDVQDVLQGLECGADNFITKPVVAAYLVSRVQGILANRRLHAQGASEAGTTLSFRGKGIQITTDKEQILDLLMATVEEFVHVAAREREEKQAREALERKQADLMKSAEQKDHFVAMLTHELRNPLQPILSSLEILRQPGADPAARERALETAERQARHLSRLMDKLFDVRRVARGKVELQRQRLDLARLVRAVAQDRHALLLRGGLTLRLELPAVPVWVSADPTRLAQALDNLLDNAAKFTNSGGCIAVRLVVDQSTHTARLTISDSGIGIQPEPLRRLSAFFAATDQSTAPGDALGLCVVKDLVHLHGGTITIASAGSGRGTEVTLCLPSKPEPPALSDISTASPTVKPKGRRILVVEDNRDAADTLEKLLALEGHETRVAYTGPDGVRAAKDWPPDLIVCDIGLPGMDGYGVARAVRGDPRTAQTHLLALTGYGSDEDRRLSREAGFNEHFTKPVDPRVLTEYIVRLGKP